MSLPAAPTSCLRVGPDCPIVPSVLAAMPLVRYSCPIVHQPGILLLAYWSIRPMRPEWIDIDEPEGKAMAMRDVAAAMQRVETVLRRRPDMGLHEDAPATARWRDGTRVVASHANGTAISTDVPDELGGSSDQVTPGWLFRAGIASCLATSIAMAAAAEGIELTTLEVRASSRSDTRGLLRMTGADGEAVYAGPQDMCLHVSISAHGVPPERLRALVQDSRRCSPIPNAVENTAPLDLRVEVT